ncbi:MAG: hypothetical protein ACQEP1_05985 [Nanobdellota archaeon]
MANRPNDKLSLALEEEFEKTRTYFREHEEAEMEKRNKGHIHLYMKNTESRIDIILNHNTIHLRYENTLYKSKMNRNIIWQMEPYMTMKKEFPDTSFKETDQGEIKLTTTKNHWQHKDLYKDITKLENIIKEYK